MIGTVLGIGSFVAIIGISQTAGGQIDKQFNVLDATQVTVRDQAAAAADKPTLSFPSDADQRIERLNGAIAAGVWWQVATHDQAVAAMPGATAGQRIETSIYAATADVFTAASTSVVSGTIFNDFHVKTHQNVVVLGAPVATQLGITSLVNQPAVYLDGRPFTVVGIIGSSQRLPQITLGVLVPSTTALDYWGPPGPSAPAQMLISTKIGAAQLIASQASLALRPYTPQWFQATAPPNPNSLKHSVRANLNSLFLLLAGVAVVIGALGIANTTLVAVLERTPEIGLRRSLGARRAHITAQFLTEAAALGTMGGLIGAALGVAATLAVTVWQNWTAVLNPIDVLSAPLAGGLVGILAGLYPGIRAATIEPAAALRR